jgi:hypothetical protein
MSFDLYREEVDNRLAGLRPVREPEPGMFDNFLAGSGKVAMQTFAKAGRAASMAAAPLAMALEKSPDSTEMQDKFFQAHDEILGSAVDHWTPKPNEVGVAGQVVGQLLGTLPLVLANPAAAIASTQLSVGEDLVRKGVDAGKAQAVGAVQAAGLGLGIWVPILGQTLAQRVLLGGAGFNVAQGLATRAASGKLLEGTAAAGDYQAGDKTAITLDLLLGVAFGGIAHINPKMRAEGDAWHARMKEWGANLKPSEVDALVALRMSQHLQVDSMPGKPVDVSDVNAHADRMRKGLDDLLNDRAPDVEGMPVARYKVDVARQVEAESVIADWVKEAEVERANQAATAAEQSALRTPATEPETPTIADPIYRQAIETMANETGWAEQGGRVLRGVDGQVSGRTSWVPNAEWWPGRPKDLSEAKARQAIAKALAGEPLKPAEQRLVDYMLDYSKERVAPALRRLEALDEMERARMASDLTAEGVDGHVRDLADYELIRQASEIDEGALEKAAIMYQNDDMAFIREAERIVGEHTSRQSNQGATPDGGGEARQAAPDATRTGAGTQEADLDPLAVSAARFAAENPDLPLFIGKNADGSDIVTTARKYLDDADAVVKQAKDDAGLFEIAADCLLGGGR